MAQGIEKKWFRPEPLFSSLLGKKSLRWVRCFLYVLKVAMGFTPQCGLSSTGMVF
jgi:hypothetical protein